MQIRLVKIGKTDSTCSFLAEKYQKRLKSWVRLEVLEFRTDQHALKYLSEPRNHGGTRLVCLDERGKLWSSPELANFIQTDRDTSGGRPLGFVVGSPYGLSKELKSLCDLSWSLSPAVFPSDLAWVMANEQIYRALSIMNGSPYHHI